jgi:hypothetical protein
LSSTPWYGDGLRFECLPDCHKCCLREGIIALAPARPGRPSETIRAAEALGMPVAEFRLRFVKRDSANGTFMEDDGKGHGCPLWKNGCSIYEARPIQCSRYPFWPDLLKSRRAWEKEAAFCPGMDQGRLFTCDEIERIRG